MGVLGRPRQLSDIAVFIKAKKASKGAPCPTGAGMPYSGLFIIRGEKSTLPPGSATSPHLPSQHGCFSAQEPWDLRVSGQEKPPSWWEPSAGRPGAGPGVLQIPGGRGERKRNCKTRKWSGSKSSKPELQSPTFATDYVGGNRGTERLVKVTWRERGGAGMTTQLHSTDIYSVSTVCRP